MRVYKQIHTRIIPEGAKKFTRRGKQFAKYKDRKGHAQEARLTKAGDKLLCESKHWHIEFEFADIRRQLTAYTNKAASEKLADVIEKIIDQADLNMDDKRYIENMPGKIRDELIGFGVLNRKNCKFTSCVAEIRISPARGHIKPTTAGGGLPKGPGVYFVWQSERIVYIGQAIDLRNRCRVNQHSHILHDCLLSWLPFPFSELIFAEAYYIGLHRPKWNYTKLRTKHIERGAAI